MKIHIIKGMSEKMLGHYMMSVIIGACSSKEDAEFIKEINEKVFGWDCSIIEIELDNKIHPEAKQKIIDAGYTIPAHLD